MASVDGCGPVLLGRVPVGLGRGTSASGSGRGGTWQQNSSTMFPGCSSSTSGLQMRAGLVTDGRKLTVQVSARCREVAAVRHPQVHASHQCGMGILRAKIFALKDGSASCVAMQGAEARFAGRIGMQGSEDEAWQQSRQGAI